VKVSDIVSRLVDFHVVVSKGKR